nr:peptidylprolyl isomerase [uncultured Prevotella sp.]
MKKILTLIACCMMGMNLSAQTANEDSLTADTTLHQVMLETTMGNIKLALYNDTPKHRDNFLKLVNEGYYNGCIFQRVIKNFMIQGGDYSCRKVTPGKVEKFDVGYTVPAEIIYPKYYHKRGQLCMAREGDDENPTKASGATDFYITWGRNFSPRQMEYLVEQMQREGKNYAIPSKEVQEGYIKYGGVPHLDNGYTVFGEVLEGLDVVDKIQNVATNKENNDRPLEDIIILKAEQIK